MNEIILPILQTFEAISLSEMDSVALMDRTDTKYALREEMLPSFLKVLNSSYRVLEVNDHRISRYESLYFDTANFNLYHNHRRERLNRFKIRYRTYVESNLHFFEVKFKNNKGRTVKQRIPHDRDEKIDGEAKIFFQNNFTINPESLENKLKVHFSRITLVNKFAPERVTIDLHLSFINKVQDHLIKNLIIAEVKQGKPFVSPFVRLMKNYHVRVGGISKYCFGVMTLYPEQPFNNFKPELIQLKKIIYDAAARA